MIDECGISGVVRTIDTLSGSVNGGGEIYGKVESGGMLIGSVGFPKCNYPPLYDGEYDVIPKAHIMQTLETDGKTMEDDVRVHEIPYWETSNVSGTTVYIADTL